jgi:hypothetical protein
MDPLKKAIKEKLIFIEDLSSVDEFRNILNGFVDKDIISNYVVSHKICNEDNKTIINKIIFTTKEDYQHTIIVDKDIFLYERRAYILNKMKKM